MDDNVHGQEFCSPKTKSIKPDNKASIAERHYRLLERCISTLNKKKRNPR